MSQSKHYLKFLNHDRMPAHGGKGQWPAPGIWTEEVEPIPCQQGWHLCRKQDILHWLHETLWVVEADGEPITDPNENNKVVARRARLVRQVEEWCPKTQRLFAADCAEHVLHHWESAYPDDKRPRKAIEVARRFARGEATEQELEDAWDAAWSATDAARSAAWSAARSAVGFAAWSAAESAARSAASDAAWVAAWVAARTAAESAVESAAGSAAWSTAWSAAGSAAAWNDAVSAERDRQIEHLFAEYLKLNPNDFH